MKAFLGTLLLAALPLLFGLWVNTTAPHPPTRAYAPARCTRYCALHGCRHATHANSLAYFRLRPVYRATVAALAAGGARWYAAANIAFYVVLMPTLLIWLTHGALRNGRVLRRLRV